MSKHHKFGVDLTAVTLEEAITAAIAPAIAKAIAESDVITAWLQVQDVDLVTTEIHNHKTIEEMELKIFKELYKSESRQNLHGTHWEAHDAITCYYFGYDARLPLKRLAEVLNLTFTRTWNLCVDLRDAGWIHIVKDKNVTEGGRGCGRCYYVFPNLDIAAARKPIPATAAAS